MALLRNPFKKAHSFDYGREADALIREYDSLTEQAGIANRIRQNTESLSYLSRFSWAEHRRVMRRTVFRVSDPELRRALIRCRRKLDEIGLRDRQRELAMAHRRRNQLDQIGPTTTWMAGVGAGGFVILSWVAGGPMWGVAIGVAATVMAMCILLNHQQAGKQAQQELTNEIVWLERDIRERIEHATFSRDEEDTAENSEVSRQRD